MKDAIQNLVSRIPKVELHIHLEGAIPLETLLRLIQRSGRERIHDLESLKARFRYSDFEDFLLRWTWKNTFIERESDFREIAYRTLQMLHAQNVRYAELFYSPADFEPNGFSITGITENLIEAGTAAAADFGIQSNWIVDLVRDFGPDNAIIVLDQVTPFRDDGVIGIGIGGTEHHYPASPFADVYREAQRRGFRLTAHAGESVGPESIWSALLDLQVERIGHGLHAYRDPQLITYLRIHQIPLEISVISNILTGVWDSVATHPIRRYFDQGLRVTINSDDPGMFQSSIHSEYMTLMNDLHFELPELKEMSLNGVRASFLPPEMKSRLMNEFEMEWESILGRGLS